MLRTKRATITALRKVSMASSNRGLRLDLIGEGVQACGSNVVLDLCLVSKKKTRGRNVPRGVISPRGGGGGGTYVVVARRNASTSFTFRPQESGRLCFLAGESVERRPWR